MAANGTDMMSNGFSVDSPTLLMYFTPTSRMNTTKGTMNQKTKFQLK